MPCETQSANAGFDDERDLEQEWGKSLEAANPRLILS
jgi:hypothetical protein